MNASVVLIFIVATFLTFVGLITFTRTWEKVLLITWFVVVLITLSSGQVHAATPPAPVVNWATYSTPGSPKLTWQPLGENARGTFYVATYQSPLIGFTFTVKQVTKGLSGRVTQIIFDDFTAACGPHGEPPDQVGAVGSVMIDAASGQYLAQYRSPDFLGTPTNPVPGSVLARATIMACYGRKS